MWQYIPRAVGFDKDGKAVAAGCCVQTTECAHVTTIPLPTDHYDFLGPLQVVGKTEMEIRCEAVNLLHEKRAEDIGS